MGCSGCRGIREFEPCVQFAGTRSLGRALLEGEVPAARGGCPKALETMEIQLFV